MSLEIDIIPTSQAPSVWAVMKALDNGAPPSLIKSVLSGPLELCETRGMLPLAIDADPTLPFYGAIMLGAGKSIGVTLTTTVREHSTEADFIEDYGRNISTDDRSRIILDWTAAGWEATVNVGGVSNYEDPAVGAMLWFGAVFAEHHAGFVMMTEGYLPYLPAGIYSPREIKSVVRQTWSL